MRGKSVPRCRINFKLLNFDYFLNNFLLKKNQICQDSSDETRQLCCVIKIKSVQLNSRVTFCFFITYINLLRLYSYCLISDIKYDKTYQYSNSHSGHKSIIPKSSRQYRSAQSSTLEDVEMNRYKRTLCGRSADSYVCLIFMHKSME